MVFKRLKTVNAALKVATLLALLQSAAHTMAQGHYYRYVNDNGVKVISSSIPPSAVAKGYDVINAAGQVVRTVDPAPKAEELERVAREKEILEQYGILARRYSTTKEIYAARDRQVAHLDANIKILNGNINNLQSQLEENMKKAASYERQGRSVPESLLDTMEGLKSEIRSTKAKLEAREEEHKKIYDEFEDLVALFKQGKLLIQKQETASRDKP